MGPCRQRRGIEPAASGFGSTNLDTGRPIIGILGGIGAGKSYVSARLAALGPGRVVDADKLAHVALAACAADGRLAETFGDDVVVDGQPDRKVLAEMVFRKATLLRRLERLIHPPVQSAIRMAVEDHRRGDGPRVLVLDVPLLIEVGLDRRCDALWYIQVPEALRLERAKARGLSGDDLERRARFQSPLERKRARADLEIRNDVDAAALDEQIVRGLSHLRVTSSAAVSTSHE